MGFKEVMKYKIYIKSILKWFTYIVGAYIIGAIIGHPQNIIQAIGTTLLPLFVILYIYEREMFGKNN